MSDPMVNVEPGLRSALANLESILVRDESYPGVGRSSAVRSRSPIAAWCWPRPPAG
jgi:hypothetical protein